ncbi:hypothetical protein D3C77_546420 [compost metagenome]
MVFDAGYPIDVAGGQDDLLLLLLAGHLTLEDDRVSLYSGRDIRVAQADTFHVFLQLLFGIGIAGGQQVDQLLARFLDETEQAHSALLVDETLDTAV